MGTIFDTPPRRDPVSHIHDASKQGDLGKVRDLLKDNPELVFSKDHDGRTPLHYAACCSPNVVELLLANKAEVNSRCNRGYAPLHLAAANGNKAAVELLLSNRAEVNAKANNGATPLQEAVAMKEPDVAELLRRHGGLE